MRLPAWLFVKTPWPTLISMMAAASAGVVICTARMFGYMRPRCSLCETTELFGKYVVGGQPLCRSCFIDLRS